MRLRACLALIAYLGVILIAPGASAAEPVDVSMIQLIATPEKYQDKLVRLVAYLRVEFEGNALYFHKEDYERALYKNGIWVSLSETNIATAAKLNDGYVIAVGIFDSKGMGHLGLWSGSLTGIQRLAPWQAKPVKQ